MFTGLTIKHRVADASLMWCLQPDILLDVTMYSKQQRAPKAQVIVQDPPHSMSRKKFTSTIMSITMIIITFDDAWELAPAAWGTSCEWLQPQAQVPLRPAGRVGNMFNLNVILGRSYSSILVEDIWDGNITAADSCSKLQLNSHRSRLHRGLPGQVGSLVTQDLQLDIIVKH